MKPGRELDALKLELTRIKAKQYCPGGCPMYGCNTKGESYALPPCEHRLAREAINRSMEEGGKP